MRYPNGFAMNCYTPNSPQPISFDGTIYGWTKTGSNVILTTSTDNVGIGTSSPRYPLEVDGSLYSYSINVGTANVGSLSFGLNPIAITSTLTNGGIQIGNGASAVTGLNPIAIGTQAIATADAAQAIGNNSSATGASAFALGPFAKSSGVFSMAMSFSATASGRNSFALGSSSTADAEEAMAIGPYANANFLDSIAIGSGSYGYNNYATAIGYTADAEGIASIALGFNSVALNNDEITLYTSDGALAGKKQLDIYNNTADFQTNNIVTSGNIGIGTTIPRQKLEVDGIIYSQTGGFRFPDNTTQTTAATTPATPTLDSVLTAGSTSTHSMSVGTTTVSTGNLLVSSGNVGIGSANPSQRLDVGTGNITTTGTITGLNGFLTGASGIELGSDLATNIAGKIKLWSAGANNYYTTLTAGTQTANANYNLPLARPTGSGQFLTATNADPSVMSWATPAGATNYWADDSTFLYPNPSRGIKVPSSDAPMRLVDRPRTEFMMSVNVLDGADSIDNSTYAAFKFGFLYSSDYFEGAGFMVQSTNPGSSSWDYYLPLYAFTNGSVALNYPQNSTAGRTVIGDNLNNLFSDAQLHVKNYDDNSYILRLVDSGDTSAFTVDSGGNTVMEGSLGIGASGGTSQLQIDSASLPSGTLVSPPAGLVSGDVWKDTTTSATNPILRIKN